MCKGVKSGKSFLRKKRKYLLKDCFPWKTEHRKKKKIHWIITVQYRYDPMNR